MHDDRSSPVEAWIEKNFSGHGRAIRRLSDDPIPGEPYMSMADAKELTREAIATFSRHAQPSPESVVWNFAKAILHGDDEHRGWLLEAARAFEAGEPLPAVRGSGAAQQTFNPGDRVSTGHTLKRRLKKSPHPSCVVNDTDCRAWEYENGGWDYERTFKPLSTLTSTDRAGKF